MQMIVLAMAVLLLLVTSEAKPNQPPNADVPPAAMPRGNMANMQNAGVVPRPTDNQDMSRKTGPQQPPLPMVPPPSAVPPPSG
ncbi:hypothetical protein TELCIR_13926 [Teladorsagia circumcincta]|uniref:Uncharacterized protein n=1 Tax=Teladorsagia circumcincta TaxID=45464 RepID=A0A2G9U2E5_TELCI|nr:hypothetical protein TELCIR_13926 [Teladorsagia circumcincta]